MTAETVAVSDRGARTRPFYWSVRREIWENKSVYIAPLVAAGVILLACLIGMHTIVGKMRDMAPLGIEQQGAELAKSFMISAIAIMLTSVLVGANYCLGALNSERRDRSILFWKSLPVSDATTVLAKLCIPFLVLPAVCVATVLALHVALLLLTTLALASAGLGVVALWTQIPFLGIYQVLVYALVVLALWYAPIYGWFLLVSGWARSKPLLWAVLPPLALCLFERIAFGSSVLGTLLKYRLTGGFATAFVIEPKTGHDWSPPPAIDPLRFLGNDGLWSGLALAAALIAAAIWLRRYREPV